MELILGLVPTGRELRDPAATIYEATDDEGRHHTVIAFDAASAAHPALHVNVRMVTSFMEYPMVTGLVELGRHDLSLGQFAYPTGSVWTVADLIRSFGDFNQVIGLRAALELAWLVGQIVIEAGDTGPVQGCFSHGNLNPWRVALRADGQVQVLGYGLPQVELLRRRSGEDIVLEPASLRYCPPERLEGVPEDASADTYSLTLLAYELATGRPLYAGHDVAALERMVGMSEGTTLLSRADHGLPPKVAKVFARALVYDPETRLSGAAYVDAIGQLLANEALSGASLSELVESLKGRQASSQLAARRLVSAPVTSAFTPAMLAAAVEEGDDEADDAEDQAPRWKKVERPRRAEPEPTSQPSVPLGSVESPPTRRLRRGPPTDEPTVEVAPPEAADGDSPRRRLRRSPADESLTSAPAPAAEAPSEGVIRRRKAPDMEEATAPLPAERRRRPPEEEDASPTRRRRGPVDDDDDDTPARRTRNA